MITYIYTLTCPIKNKVFYVGKTINPKDRYKSHCHPKNANGRHLRNYLTYLKNKNLLPIFEIIDEVFGEWDYLEKYWISQFKTWGFKLTNATSGGEKNYTFKHSDEAKKLISEKQFGRKLDINWRNNISRGKTGVKFSSKHLDNLSKSHIGNSNIYCYKEVYKLDDNFDIIKKYDSITNALSDINADIRSGSITKACKSKDKLMKAYGFYWCYANDYNELNHDLLNINYKYVLKIDIKTGDIVNKYKTVKECAADNNCHQSAISHICNDRRGSCNGSLFLFEDDYTEELVNDIKKHALNNYYLEQLDLNGNIINTFKNIKEAETNLNIRHISCVCSGNRNVAGGYKWRKIFY